MAVETIFIAIAAYRDEELEITIRDCLDKADEPSRVHFGICLQYDNLGPPETRRDCIDHRLGDERFRVEKYDYRQSQGGCWARHIVQQMYAGETYTLQVDSHSRFRRGWDTLAIEMLNGLPSAKPIITSSPPLYFRENGVDRYTHLDELNRINTTVAEYWADEGWIHHPNKYLPENSRVPRRTRFLSGGFVFTTGEWNRVVAQDPQHYYTGEEFALTLRSFTHGYDLFDPSEIVVWHRCHPEPNRKHFSDNADGVARDYHLRAMKRLRALYQGDPEGILGRFTLGRVRTLEDYRLYSGLDCATYTIHPNAANGVPPDPPS